MKFQKTINLWEDGIEDKLLRGELKLQTGQYVVCGANNRKARWIGFTKGGSMLVQHEQGSPSENEKRFNALRGIKFKTSN